jgi:hypothetical protein
MYLNLTEDEKIAIRTVIVNTVKGTLSDDLTDAELDHIYCDFYGTDYMLTVGYHVFYSYFEVQVQDFTITEFSYSSHDCILNNFAKEFAIEGKTEVLNSRDEVLLYLMQVQVPSLDFSDYCYED